MTKYILDNRSAADVLLITRTQTSSETEVLLGAYFLFCSLIPTYFNNQDDTTATRNNDYAKLSSRPRGTQEKLSSSCVVHARCLKETSTPLRFVLRSIVDVIFPSSAGNEARSSGKVLTVCKRCASTAVGPGIHAQFYDSESSGRFPAMRQPFLSAALGG